MGSVFKAYGVFLWGDEKGPRQKRQSYHTVDVRNATGHVQTADFMPCTFHLHFQN